MQAEDSVLFVIKYKQKFSPVRNILNNECTQLQCTLHILKTWWHFLEFLVWEHKPEQQRVHLNVKNHVLYISIINNKKHISVNRIRKRLNCHYAFFMEDGVTKLLLHEKIIKEYVARNFGKKVLRLCVRHLFILIFSPLEFVCVCCQPFQTCNLLWLLLS